MLKDFIFIVKCNDGPVIKIGVIAEDYEQAKRWAKDMYAEQYTIYADDRYNNWLIKEV
jgi:hypothetical protein